jgi:membrane associated rhomboid family serine protease
MPQYRSRYSSSFVHDYFPPGLKWLLISNTAVFVLQYLFASTVGPLTREWLALSAVQVVRHLYLWQLATYMFLHGGIWHLLFNMLTLWIFGMQLEREWGTRRFLKYYFYCGIAAGVCVVLINTVIALFSSSTQTANFYWGVPTIGASGAIFGILVAFGVLYPNQTVLMNFLFPIKAKYMVMIYAGIELLMTFGPNTGVSTIAHLGGMAFGYVYLKGRLPRIRMRVPEIGGAYRQWKLQRAKKKFQVYMRKHGRGPWVN